MVMKILHILGLLVATIFYYLDSSTTVSAAPAAQLVKRRDVIADLPQYSYANHHPPNPDHLPVNSADAILADQEDPGSRNQRSANLSHVTGTARKIQMFIKNRHLQILPDGTVNGTTDDTSSFTILQRMTVGIGQVKIQGVATCQYLCMASCGILYGATEFSDECVFNESISQSNYNMYTSTKYSSDKRTYYLALNRRGQSRKVLTRARTSLGKLSSYARVLTRTVPLEIRHQSQICSIHPLSEEQDAKPAHERCPKKKKKKKVKKKKKKKKKPCLKKPVVCQNRLKKRLERLKAKCDVNNNSKLCQRYRKQMDKTVLQGGAKLKVKKKKASIKKGGGKHEYEQSEQAVPQLDNGNNGHSGNLSSTVI